MNIVFWGEGVLCALSIEQSVLKRFQISDSGVAWCGSSENKPADSTSTLFASVLSRTQLRLSDTLLHSRFSLSYVWGYNKHSFQEFDRNANNCSSKEKRHQNSATSFVFCLWLVSDCYRPELCYEQVKIGRWLIERKARRFF